MKHTTSQKIYLALALAGATFLAAQETLKLPEGDNGIAANYTNDEGIEKDPAVIVADNFENHTDKGGLHGIWNSVFNQVSLSREKAHVFHGNQSVEFTVPERRAMASGCALYLKEKQDRVFLRYYSKFDPGFNVMGSAHTGGGISGGYYKNGKASAGEPANGKNKFAVALDTARQKGLPEVANPGSLGIYIYHPGQRHRWGDFFYPSGMVIPYSYKKGDFGEEFVSRENVVPTLGTWHCHEVMLQANTPGQKDGRVAAWIDGKIAMDFPNLRLRDIDTLKIDHLQFGLFIGPGKHKTTRKWYDNVVAATSYIGPMKQ